MYHSAYRSPTAFAFWYRSIVSSKVNWNQPRVKRRFVPRKAQNFVPEYTAVTANDVAKLQDFLNTHHRITILTGAGVSTESGQPDYRSKDVGLYARSSHRPVQFRNFMCNEHIRKRYWLRNFSGWETFFSLEPNDCHYILADWERSGKISSLITQNVDRLHHKAGSVNAIELHGTTHFVKCMNCSYITSRTQLQEVFLSLNPTFQVRNFLNATLLRPDGDTEVDLEDLEKFNVPSCPECGGTLKPDVVFFGESVPGDLVRRVYQKVDEGEALLVLGSSLKVFSGYRFVLHAADLKKPIAIVNIGETRADHLTSVKIDTKCSEVLQQIVLN